MYLCPETFVTQDDNSCGRCADVIARVELTVSVRESPPAAGALTVEALGQCGKRRRLRECHDGLERQRTPMRVVTICDAACGMAKDFDG